MYCQSEVCRSKVRPQYVPEVCSELGVYGSEYVSPKYVDLEYVRSTFLKCVPSWERIDRSMNVSPKYVDLEYVRSAFLKCVPSWECMDRSMSVRSVSI